ncbi:ubiquitin-conjugating enzyme E2 J1-like [Cimex lectularius]|uniref:UBC core domain-containing protein n=1 Tax=Cimex lectularius TaxID=79782 RepID=A0A8I6SBA3_CIMLE|nr:ubiquitin-conjugating enzyme E2 J1-like [Cimex lectularius]
MQDLESKYNKKIPAVKRLMREACELKDATEEYSAHPLEDNLFEWHFTVRGAPGTEFENGIYHGRIILPTQYPMAPPHIVLLTPNGRFETNKKICLSISGYHPETWQPSWSIRTALLALIAFMPTAHKGAIGSLDYTPEERRALAKKTRKWECPQCGLIINLLGGNVPSITSDESQLIKSVMFKAEDSTIKSEPKNEVKEKQIEIKEDTREPEGIDQSMVYEENSGFWISERSSNILICILVMAISVLLYRRLF